MKRSTFASLVAGSFASIQIVPVRAAQFDWKFAHDSTVDHPINVRAVQAFESIRKQTNGRLNIRSFPNNQLGNVTEMLTQVRSGAIELHAAADGVLDGVVPLASINNIAFAFKSRPAVFAAMDGELGALVRNAVSEQGLVVLDRMWENGFRDFTNSVRPIRGVTDLQGMKIRVSPSKLRLDTFRSMGLTLIQMPSSELYSAMQTRVVDGQETPLVYAASQHYYEVQKYASLTHHMWSGYWNVINANHWRALPRDLQTILREQLNAAANLERHDVDLLDGSVRDKLTRLGLSINDVDSATFKAKVAASGYYGRWKSTFGDAAWSVLEKYAGKLG